MKIAGPGHLGEQRGAGGRPGHLVRYLRQSGISEPIVVLSQARADDWDWFARYSAFFDRHIRQGESLGPCASDLGITMEMAAHLVDRIRTLGCEAVGRHLVASLSSVLKTLPTLRQRARRQQADVVGKSLINVTRKNPSFVQHVVSGYSSAANQRMRIVLTRQEDAHFSRTLIEFVGRLNVQGLGIRVVGFRVGDQRSDAGQWLKALARPVHTSVHWVNAPNKNSSASTRHFGIEVVRRDVKGGERIDGAFCVVMLLAAVVEIWRLPFTAKRELARKKVSQPWAVQMPLFDEPSAQSFR